MPGVRPHEIPDLQLTAVVVRVHLGPLSLASMTHISLTKPQAGHVLLIVDP